MGNSRKKPEKLPAKLLAIRLKLEVSQSQLLRLLDTDKTTARISEYEHGIREPDLNTLLKYAKLARVSLDTLADDNRELKFRKNWKKPRRVNEILRRDGLRRIQINSDGNTKARTA